MSRNEVPVGRPSAFSKCSIDLSRRTSARARSETSERSLRESSRSASLRLAGIDALRFGSRTFTRGLSRCWPLDSFEGKLASRGEAGKGTSLGEMGRARSWAGTVKCGLAEGGGRCGVASQSEMLEDR